MAAGKGGFLGGRTGETGRGAPGWSSSCSPCPRQFLGWGLAPSFAAPPLPAADLPPLLFLGLNPPGRASHAEALCPSLLFWQAITLQTCLLPQPPLQFSPMFHALQHVGSNFICGWGCCPPLFGCAPPPPPLLSALARAASNAL